MLKAFVEAIVLMYGHAGIIILVDLVKVLQLLDLLVSLLDVLPQVKIGHVSDHSDQMRPVFLLLKILLLWVGCDAVFFLPVLEFVLVSAHFVYQAAEVVMIRGVWGWVQRDGFCAGRACHFGGWLGEDCSSGERTDVGSEYFVVGLFFQDFGALADMRMRAPPIILILIEGEVHPPSVFFLQLPVFVIDLEAGIDLGEGGLLHPFQLGLKLLLKVDFSLILEFILHLLHFEHLFGIDRLPLPFHELPQEDVLWWYAFLEEILEVLFVLLDEVVVFRDGVGGGEDGLWIARVVVQLCEDGFVLVLAFVFAVGTREGGWLGRSLLALCSHFYQIYYQVGWLTWKSQLGNGCQKDSFCMTINRVWQNDGKVMRICI